MTLKDITGLLNLSIDDLLDKLKTLIEEDVKRPVNEFSLRYYNGENRIHFTIDGERKTLDDKMFAFFIKQCLRLKLKKKKEYVWAELSRTKFGTQLAMETKNEGLQIEKI